MLMSPYMRPQRARQRPHICILLQEPLGRRDRPASRAPQVSFPSMHRPYMDNLTELVLS